MPSQTLRAYRTTCVVVEPQLVRHHEIASAAPPYESKFKHYRRMLEGLRGEKGGNGLQDGGETSGEANRTRLVVFSLHSVSFFTSSVACLFLAKFEDRKRISARVGLSLIHI